MKPPYHQTIDLSHYARLFIVGDIHGEFAMLEEKLQEVKFDTDKDGLLFVGDLIDRGPDSLAALDWIKRPYTHRVLGNHDVLPKMVCELQLSAGSASNWGGDWFLKKSTNEIHAIAEAMDDAPVALTVLTPKGNRIGVTHADCFADWNKMVDYLTQTPAGWEWVYDLCIFSRQTIQRLMKAQKHGEPFNVEAATVKGIDHVFHGHTVLGKPFTIANRSWIDTGACYGGELTLVNVDDVVKHTRRA